MGFSQFPAPAAAGAGAGFAATIADMSTTFKHDNNFEAGVYQVTVSPTTTDVRMVFATDSAVITSQATTSGEIGFNLTSAATKVFITGAPGGTAFAIVQIQKTADTLASVDIGSGTLDTINTTSTYNETGVLGVLVLSGGEGGIRNPGNPGNLGGDGGRAGFINGDVVVTNTATTVTIGAGGIGQTENAARIASNNSSFGNLVTASTASNFFTNGHEGGGTGAQAGNGNVGIASGIFPSFNGNDTTGGGSGGNGLNGNFSLASAGSGIGTGGTSSPNPNGAPVASSGKAAGGSGGRGGTGDVRNHGGDGTGGVVYVLRGF